MRVKNGIPFLSNCVLLTLLENQTLGLSVYERETSWALGVKPWKRLNSF